MKKLHMMPDGVWYVSTEYDRVLLLLTSLLTSPRSISSRLSPVCSAVHKPFVL